MKMKMSASTIVKDSNVDGVHGEIRRPWDPEFVPTLGHVVGGSRTLYEAFRHGAKLNPLGPCMGFRAVSTSGLATPFIYSSYSECLARINAFAAGLDELQLLLQSSSSSSSLSDNKNKNNKAGYYPCLGLCLKNCMEWIMAEQGAYAIGGVTVPLYDTFDPATAAYILKQTQTKTVVCTRNELPKLCQAKRLEQEKQAQRRQRQYPTNYSSTSADNNKNNNDDASLDCFTTVLLVDGVTRDAAMMAEEASLVALSYAQVEAVGARRMAENGGHKHSPPSPLDLATFCYTSGTTGMPKGAMLSHQNFASTMAGLVAVSGFLAQIHDRHLSYLPLAHIFERVVINQIFASGASVAFYRGEPQYLIEDMQACRPTILPVAPRVLNKIYDKIMVGIAAAGGMKKKLFDAAVATKTKNLVEHGHLTHALYDRLIFNKIKKGLGMDHLRFMVSGSAPLASHIMTFFRILLAVPVVEGYGQTEGTAAATVALPSDVSTAGHVGGPMGCVEIALFDVPEMGYHSTDKHHSDGTPCQGRGEVCVRGPNVFMGYYKDAEKTKETVDADGWLHSGDIGLWRLDGTLQIIDRKKNLFKLAQGEYVAPEKIENILTRSTLIAQCFVHGDSLQTSLVAIVVPDEEVVVPQFLAQTLQQQQQQKQSFAELCRSSKELKAAIMKDIQQLSKQSGLHGFEVVKAIFVEHEPFSVENDLLTPTFKLKRQQCKNRYLNEINHLYATEVPPPKSRL